MLSPRRVAAAASTAPVEMGSTMTSTSRGAPHVITNSNALERLPPMPPKPVLISFSLSSWPPLQPSQVGFRSSQLHHSLDTLRNTGIPIFQCCLVGGEAALVADLIMAWNPLRGVCASNRLDHGFPHGQYAVVQTFIIASTWHLASSFCASFYEAGGEIGEPFAGPPQDAQHCHDTSQQCIGSSVPSCTNTVHPLRQRMPFKTQRDLDLQN